ncbi:MAG: alkaline phosphatase family protein [Acidimicrobiia bacterium]|nr:alkaline phosphatase family protein [Acidimicrobiia bacterium]
MLPPAPPSYDGRGLVNLVAEIEHRLTGGASSPRLEPAIADGIPSGDGVVLVLFDGLGSMQLDHRAATDLRATRIAEIDAPFSTMTTVSLATIATGVPPVRHGLIGYKMWLPEHSTIVNTIHMSTAWGEPIDGLDHATFLPPDNLWERLASAGCEPIVVQPGNFEATPLTKTLYRGARFESYWSATEAASATIDLAGPGRMVFLYLPHVDFAAHVNGQDSPEYVEALATVNRVWATLSMRLPDTITLVGTADHGHVDIPESRRFRLPDHSTPTSRITEDGRILYVHGDGSGYADEFGGVWHPLGDVDWWGPGVPHPAFALRRPDGIVFLPPGVAVLTPHGNPRLTGFHGGLEPDERLIPVLSRSSA